MHERATDSPTDQPEAFAGAAEFAQLGQTNVEAASAAPEAVDATMESVAPSGEQFAERIRQAVDEATAIIDRATRRTAAEVAFPDELPSELDQVWARAAQLPYPAGDQIRPYLEQGLTRARQLRSEFIGGDEGLQERVAADETSARDAATTQLDQHPVAGQSDAERAYEAVMTPVVSARSAVEAAVKDESSLRQSGLMIVRELSDQFRVIREQGTESPQLTELAEELQRLVTKLEFTATAADDGGRNRVKELKAGLFEVNQRAVAAVRPFQT